MPDWSLDGEPDTRTCCDGFDACGWPSGFLVTAHERVVDFGETLVRPFVRGSADKLPLVAEIAVDDESGEGVSDDVRALFG